MEKKESFVKGAFCATFGALLWAVSGACGQVLFQSCHFDAQWLTVTRLLVAGVVLMILGFAKNGKGMFDVWKNRRDAIDMVIYGIGGLLGLQYTYFLAIQYSNATTATVIQYLMPAMVMVYMAIRTKTSPTKIEILALILAITGVYLVATHGNPKTLQLTPVALFWCIMGAVTMAFQTVQPKRLLDKFGTPISNAWGMMIGGLTLCVFRRPWDFGDGVWTIKALIVVCGVIIFGTILSFFFYLEGVRIIGATKASLYACTEPLAAALIGVFLLNVAFGLIDWIGSAMIISTIFLTSMPKKEKTEP